MEQTTSPSERYQELEQDLNSNPFNPAASIPEVSPVSQSGTSQEAPVVTSQGNTNPNYTQNPEIHSTQPMETSDFAKQAGGPPGAIMAAFNIATGGARTMVEMATAMVDPDIVNAPTMRKIEQWQKKFSKATEEERYLLAAEGLKLEEELKRPLKRSLVDIGWAHGWEMGNFFLTAPLVFLEDMIEDGKKGWRATDSPEAMKEFEQIRDDVGKDIVLYAIVAGMYKGNLGMPESFKSKSGKYFEPNAIGKAIEEMNTKIKNGLPQEKIEAIKKKINLTKIQTIITGKAILDSVKKVDVKGIMDEYPVKLPDGTAVNIPFKVNYIPADFSSTLKDTALTIKAIYNEKNPQARELYISEFQASFTNLMQSVAESINKAKDSKIYTEFAAVGDKVHQEILNLKASSPGKAEALINYLAKKSESIKLSIDKFNEGVKAKVIESLEKKISTEEANISRNLGKNLDKNVRDTENKLSEDIIDDVARQKAEVITEQTIIPEKAVEAPIQQEVVPTTPKAESAPQGPIEPIKQAPVVESKPYSNKGMVKEDIKLAETQTAEYVATVKDAVTKNKDKTDAPDTPGENIASGTLRATSLVGAAKEGVKRAVKKGRVKESDLPKINKDIKEISDGIEYSMKNLSKEQLSSSLKSLHKAKLELQKELVDHKKVADIDALESTMLEMKNVDNAIKLTNKVLRDKSAEAPKTAAKPKVSAEQINKEFKLDEKVKWTEKDIEATKLTPEEISFIYREAKAQWTANGKAMKNGELKKEQIDNQANKLKNRIENLKQGYGYIKNEALYNEMYQSMLKKQNADLKVIGKSKNVKYDELKVKHDEIHLNREYSNLLENAWQQHPNKYLKIELKGEALGIYRGRLKAEIAEYKIANDLVKDQIKLTPENTQGILESLADYSYKIQESKANDLFNKEFIKKYNKLVEDFNKSEKEVTPEQLYRQMEETTREVGRELLDDKSTFINQELGRDFLKSEINTDAITSEAIGKMTKESGFDSTTSADRLFNNMREAVTENTEAGIQSRISKTLDENMAFEMGDSILDANVVMMNTRALIKPEIHKQYKATGLLPERMRITEEGTNRVVTLPKYIVDQQVSGTTQAAGVIVAKDGTRITIYANHLNTIPVRFTNPIDGKMNRLTSSKIIDTGDIYNLSKLKPEAINEIAHINAVEKLYSKQNAKTQELVMEKKHFRTMQELIDANQDTIKSDAAQYKKLLTEMKEGEVVFVEARDGIRTPTKKFKLGEQVVVKDATGQPIKAEVIDFEHITREAIRKSDYYEAVKNTRKPNEELNFKENYKLFKSDEYMNSYFTKLKELNANNSLFHDRYYADLRTAMELTPGVFDMRTFVKLRTGNVEFYHPKSTPEYGGYRGMYNLKKSVKYGAALKEGRTVSFKDADGARYDVRRLKRSEIEIQVPKENLKDFKDSAFEVTTTIINKKGEVIKTREIKNYDAYMDFVEQPKLMPFLKKGEVISADGIPAKVVRKYGDNKISEYTYDSAGVNETVYTITPHHAAIIDSKGTVMFIKSDMVQPGTKTIGKDVYRWNNITQAPKVKQAPTEPGLYKIVNEKGSTETRFIDSKGTDHLLFDNKGEKYGFDKKTKEAYNEALQKTQTKAEADQLLADFETRQTIDRLFEIRQEYMETTFKNKDFVKGLRKDYTEGTGRNLEKKATDDFYNESTAAVYKKAAETQKTQKETSRKLRQKGTDLQESVERQHMMKGTTLMNKVLNEPVKKKSELTIEPAINMNKSVGAQSIPAMKVNGKWMDFEALANSIDKGVINAFEATEKFFTTPALQQFFSGLEPITKNPLSFIGDMFSSTKDIFHSTKNRAALRVYDAVRMRYSFMQEITKQRVAQIKRIIKAENLDWNKVLDKYEKGGYQYVLTKRKGLTGEEIATRNIYKIVNMVEPSKHLENYYPHIMSKDIKKAIKVENLSDTAFDAANRKIEVGKEQDISMHHERKTMRQDYLKDPEALEIMVHHVTNKSLNNLLIRMTEATRENIREMKGVDSKALDYTLSILDKKLDYQRQAQTVVDKATSNALQSNEGLLKYSVDLATRLNLTPFKMRNIKTIKEGKKFILKAEVFNERTGAWVEKYINPNEVIGKAPASYAMDLYRKAYTWAILGWHIPRAIQQLTQGIVAISTTNPSLKAFGNIANALQKGISYKGSVKKQIEYAKAGIFENLSDILMFERHINPRELNLLERMGDHPAGPMSFMALAENFQRAFSYEKIKGDLKKAGVKDNINSLSGRASREQSLQYGKFETEGVFESAHGKLATPFWSYPVKQLKLLYNMAFDATRNPATQEVLQRIYNAKTPEQQASVIEKLNSSQKIIVVRWLLYSSAFTAALALAFGQKEADKFDPIRGTHKGHWRAWTRPAIVNSPERLIPGRDAYVDLSKRMGRSSSEEIADNPQP